MKSMRGIVISLDKKTMVVVTDEGDFVEVPVPAARPYPGETVEISLPTKKGFTRPTWVGLAVALLILVLSLGIAKPFLMPRAVAAVSLDLTSGIELKVDDQNRVVNVSASGTQGQELLQELELKGEDIYLAVNKVALRAQDLGYLQEDAGNTILVAVIPLKGSGINGPDRDRLQQTMHDELARNNFQGYLVVQRAETDLRQEADRMGLTVNQYLLWERSKDQGAEISINELKDRPMEQLAASDENKMERMFPGMWCRVGSRSLEPMERNPGRETGEDLQLLPGPNQREANGYDSGNTPPQARPGSPDCGTELSPQWRGNCRP